jgi:hypothetical protein
MLELFESNENVNAPLDIQSNRGGDPESMIGRQTKP